MSPISAREQIGNDFLAFLARKESEEKQAHHFLGELMEVYPLQSAAILVLDKEGSLVLFAHRGLSGGFIKDFYVRKTVQVIDAAMSGEVVLQGGDPRVADPAWRFEHEAGALYAAPCRIYGKTAGVFVAEFREPVLADPVIREAFAAYAQMSAVLLAMKGFHREASRIQETDYLTGLGTFKAFHEVLFRELPRAKRSGQPVSLVFIKIRYLREMNDMYGHVEADRALIELAEMVKGLLRGVDFIARSGSSFYVMMPGTPKEKAAAVAERIVAKMEATPAGKKDVVLKMAVGVGTFPADGDTERELIPHVDDMVHESVRKGGNAFTVFGD